ncbi:MAG: type IV pilus assembly protein PilM [Candidatus Omnitrophica bacterium]|nr:type IV pilus assembly protein PilM [Candidatus Omnitrophota bacterium]
MMKFVQISKNKKQEFKKIALDYGRKLYRQLQSTSLFHKEPQNTGPVSTIACDYGHSKIIFVEMQKSESGLHLIRFHKSLRSDGNKVGVDMIKKIFTDGKYSHSRVRVSVKGQGVVVRFIQFPQMKHEDVRSAISFEAEKYIPFKAEEVIIDYHVLDENIVQGTGTFMNLLLVAVRRDELNPVIQTFHEAGLQVEFVDVDALASMNSLEYFHPEEWKKSVGFIDFGAEISSLCIIREGKPRFMRDISFGGMDFIKRLKRKLGVTEEKAREHFLQAADKPSPEVIPIIQESVETLIADLKVSLDYYLDQIPNAQPLQKLFISGTEAYHPQVVQMLSKEFSIPVEPMNILEKLTLGPDVDKRLVMENQGFLPVPIGLCLRDQ